MPSDLVQADDGAVEGNEGKMDVTAAFVAYDKAATMGELGARALLDAPVAAKVLTAVDAATCDAGLDAALSALVVTSTVVIALVGMQLDRTST